jgi:hypothetical protein
MEYKLQAHSTKRVKVYFFYSSAASTGFWEVKWGSL